MTRGEDSRRALLDAAKTLLWDQGFEATSPAAVLKASGVGHGSLYHHFPSKRALGRAALEEVARDLIAQTDGMFSPERPPAERLRTWLARERDGLHGCRMGRLAPERSIKEDGYLREPLAGYFRHLQGLIAEALREAGLPPGLDAAVLAETLVSVVQGGYVLSASLDDGAAVNRATAGAAALLDRILPANR